MFCLWKLPQKSNFGRQHWFFTFTTSSRFQFSSIIHFLDHGFWNPSCRICSYGPHGPFWCLPEKTFWYGKALPKKNFREKSLFEIITKNEFILWRLVSKAPLCYEAPAGAFASGNIAFLDFLDLSILEKCAFPYIWWLFQKWPRRPNDYAHAMCIEILCRTPVSKSRYVWSGVQMCIKNPKYSSLARMSTETWIQCICRGDG